MTATIKVNDTSLTLQCIKSCTKQMQSENKYGYTRAEWYSFSQQTHLIATESSPAI